MTLRMKAMLNAYRGYDSGAENRLADGRNLALLAIVVLLASWTGACGETETRPDAAPPAVEPAAVSAEPPEAVRDALAAGNAAYRAGRYEEALARYREAVGAGPDQPAAHFGVYLAARALGDSALADSALLRVSQTGPEGEGLLMHVGSAGPHGAAPDSARRP